MRRNLVTAVSLLAVLALGACSTTEGTEGTEGSVSSIKSALELENGGLDMEDEQPGFGLYTATLEK